MEECMLYNWIVDLLVKRGHRDLNWSDIHYTLNELVEWEEGKVYYMVFSEAEQIYLSEGIILSSAKYIFVLSYSLIQNDPHGFSDLDEYVTVAEILGDIEEWIENQEKP